MWARHIEVILGIWLGISRFIFHYPEGYEARMTNDFICMVSIILFSLLTYRDRFRYTHLLNLLIGSWLIAWVFAWGIGVGSPPDQNYMVVGLLLLMLGVVPSRTKEPPRGWIEFNGRGTE